jgi:hypothetical protein
MHCAHTIILNDADGLHNKVCINGTQIWYTKNKGNKIKLHNEIKKNIFKVVIINSATDFFFTTKNSHDDLHGHHVWSLTTGNNINNYCTYDKI